jgi:hypothetical protein
LHAVPLWTEEPGSDVTGISKIDEIMLVSRALEVLHDDPDALSTENQAKAWVHVNDDGPERGMLGLWNSSVAGRRWWYHRVETTVSFHSIGLPVLTCSKGLIDGVVGNLDARRVGQ